MDTMMLATGTLIGLWAWALVLAVLIWRGR